jgi:hypothetical protein
MWMFELAFNLQMPMYQLEAEMPQEELLMWAKYFEARPVGWRDDHRAAMIISSSGNTKAKPQQIFSSLAQMHKWEEERPDEEVINRSLKTSVFGAMLETALEEKKGE